MADEHVDDIQEVIRALEEELRPVATNSLIEAIHHGDKDAVVTNSFKLKGLTTLDPKREAIIAGRSDFFEVLLREDPTIDEDMVATACERKDRDIIRILLDFGWPIDKPLYSMASLLCTAIDDLNLMQWFIENGADVDARSTVNESALSIAIARGSLDVVEFLLARGTDTKHGDLLHCAAQRKNQSEGAQLVEILVQKGADVNAYRFNNPVAFRWRAMFKLPTPLHVACSERNSPVAIALLKNGADPHRQMLEAGEPTPPTSIERALEINDQGLINLLKASELSI
ncbi:hypothetical protein LTR95_001521 [Oleoguttula sp. CCFEE 5521]